VEVVVGVMVTILGLFLLSAAEKTSWEVLFVLFMEASVF